MSFDGRFTCNVCTNVKGEANHWRMAQPLENGILFMRWDDRAARLPVVIHLCGDECAHKQLSQFLGRPEPTKK